jgi:Uma2 family endonuclease
MTSTTLPSGAVVYPDSDGKRMAENTKQYEWIVTIKGNLDVLFRDRADVFVAGDHLIYAVQGDPKKRRAPDVYVAFGRPKGHRGSYKVWEEGNVFPQVVFEILSPKNTAEEMRKKKLFYRVFGAEEYYVIDPEPTVPTLDVFVRQGRRFVPRKADGFVSPRLGIRFQFVGPDLVLTNPDGSRFLSFLEFGQLAADERQQAEAEKKRAEAEKKRAEAEKKRADSAEVRADAEAARAVAEAATRAKLAAKLREMGVDPDTV